MPLDFSSQLGKKLLTQGGKKIFIDLVTILFIEREEYLSTIYLNCGKQIREIKPLHLYEKELFEMGFFRIRDNLIINGNHISEVDIRMFKREVIVSGNRFVIAKNRLKSFKEWIS